MIFFSLDTLFFIFFANPLSWGNFWEVLRRIFKDFALFSLVFIFSASKCQKPWFFADFVQWSLLKKSYQKTKFSSQLYWVKTRREYGFWTIPARRRQLLRCFKGWKKKLWIICEKKGENQKKCFFFIKNKVFFPLWAYCRGPFTLNSPYIHLFHHTRRCGEFYYKPSRFGKEYMFPKTNNSGFWIISIFLHFSTLQLGLLFNL